MLIFNNCQKTENNLRLWEFLNYICDHHISSKEHPQAKPKPLKPHKNLVSQFLSLLYEIIAYKYFCFLYYLFRFKKRITKSFEKVMSEILELKLNF